VIPELLPSAVSFVDENTPINYPLDLTVTDSNITAIDALGFINNSGNPGTIQITLVNENGDPVPGAFVSISDDDANGTLTYVSPTIGFTDANGNFTIDVNNSEVETSSKRR